MIIFLDEIKERLKAGRPIRRVDVRELIEQLEAAQETNVRLMQELALLAKEVK